MIRKRKPRWTAAQKKLPQGSYVHPPFKTKAFAHGPNYGMPWFTIDIEGQPASKRYSVIILRQLNPSSFVSFMPTITLTDSWEHALWIVSGVSQAQVCDNYERRIIAANEWNLDTSVYRLIRRAHKIFLRQVRARAKRKRRKLLLNRLRAR